MDWHPQSTFTRATAMSSTLAGMEIPEGVDRDETLEEHIAAGGDRRSFIKKSVALAGGLWVTPVIADKLITPAGASGAVNRLQYTVAAGGTTSVTPDATNPTCVPAGWAAAPNGSAATDNVTVVGTNTTDPLVFNITSGTCIFTAGSAHSDFNECLAGTISLAGKRISFTPTNTNNKKLNQVRLVLSC